MRTTEIQFEEVNEQITQKYINSLGDGKETNYLVKIKHEYDVYRGLDENWNEIIEHKVGVEIKLLKVCECMSGYIGILNTNMAHDFNNPEYKIIGITKLNLK